MCGPFGGTRGCEAMAPVVSCLLLAGAALAHPSHDEYMLAHGKQYATEERSRRAAVYAANLARIDEQNADAGRKWTAAVNEFADWTNDEFRAQRTGTRPMAGGAAMDTSVLRAPAADAVDWRTKDGVLSAVKDQKSCGSCWAFSAVETFESAVAIATGSAAPVLSPQQVVSCAPNPDKCGGTGGCQGSTQQLAFNYTATAGLTTEKAYPYKSGGGSTGKCDTTKIAPAATNTGYVTVPVNDYNALVAAVNQGPVAVTVAAGGFGWQTYGGGILPCKSDFTLDHGIQLVGYGESKKDGMYWIIRNSWGASWGESGFARLQRYGDGKEPCGDDTKPGDGIACNGNKTVVNYCGSCGIMSSSSYPTGVAAVKPTRWHCDTATSTCALAVAGHSTQAKCEAACN